MATEFKRIDFRYSYSETDTHVYFVGSPLSQWAIGEFQGQLEEGSELITFNCAEQYMMAGKAMLFRDYKSLDKIMATYHPREQKQLGREVQNFDLAAWEAEAKNIVRRGGFYKFSQIQDYRDFLESTGDRMIVEGAHYDPVWGVKLSFDDPRILDEANWQGTNWLGECLMDDRKALRELDSVRIMHPHAQFDVWKWAVVV